VRLGSISWRRQSCCALPPCKVAFRARDSFRGPCTLLLMPSAGAWSRMRGTRVHAADEARNAGVQGARGSGRCVQQPRLSSEAAHGGSRTATTRARHARHAEQSSRSCCCCCGARFVLPLHSGHDAVLRPIRTAKLPHAHAAVCAAPGPPRLLIPNEGRERGPLSDSES
jgi:hypothetical protein